MAVRRKKRKQAELDRRHLSAIPHGFHVFYYSPGGVQPMKDIQAPGYFDDCDILAVNDQIHVYSSDRRYALLIVTRVADGVTLKELLYTNLTER